MAILWHYVSPGSSPEHVTPCHSQQETLEETQKLVCLPPANRASCSLGYLGSHMKKGHNILIFKQALEGQTYDLISQTGYLKLQNNNNYQLIQSFLHVRLCFKYFILLTI